MPGIRISCVCILTLVVVLNGCGNEPYCPEGFSWCWAQCVDLMTDDRHCGSCVNACSSNQTCVEGLCCKSGYTNCNGVCVNINWDDKNCGSCGKECESSAECINGGCMVGDSCTDLFPWMIECGMECVNPKTDENHCGGCDIKCDVGMTCCEGQCVDSGFDVANCGDCGIVCRGGLACCSGECTDTLTDSENCGQCGNACGSTFYCRYGKCCTVGGSCSNTVCDVPDDCPVCVDVLSNNDHCGACNNPCEDWEACCQGSCADMLSDNENCGSCGNSCEVSNGFVCQDGICTCIAGEECQPGACTYLEIDEENCGACGNTCPRCSAYCRDGYCVFFGCSPPNVTCTDPDGCTRCVNLNTDNDHCGQCGNSCDVANGFICQDGACSCFPGGTDCGGYCASLESDAASCGACGYECAPCDLCRNGVCQTNECFPPRTLCIIDEHDCNCADLASDNYHCGSCNTPCDFYSGFDCQNGICECRRSLTDCGGACIDLETDIEHCGQCNVVCDADQICCQGICTDPRVDVANCGSCSNACPAGETCIYGYCSVDGYPDLYSSCSGNPFIPACEDLSCVEGEEVLYFDLFMDELLKIFDNDTQYLQDHIFINDVSITPHSDNRIFRVSYLFVYDWVRIRTNAEVRRLDPFSEASFRQQITSPGFGIEIKRKVSQPVDFGEIVAAIESCKGSLDEVNWCFVLGFSSSAGDLMVSGDIGTLDFISNDCACIEMYLETGNYGCRGCACWITR